MFEEFRKAQPHLLSFANDTAGMAFRKEADRRRGEGLGPRGGAFGGSASRLGIGADRGSQEAAKIINSGTTNLTAAEKAAIESAKTEREIKAATEKLLDWFRTKPPIVLGVGAF